MSNVSDLMKHHEQLQFRFTPQQHVGALTVYHVQYLTLRGSVADLTTGHPLDLRNELVECEEDQPNYVGRRMSVADGR
jgi:hypothetical protein